MSSLPVRNLNLYKIWTRNKILAGAILKKSLPSEQIVCELLSQNTLNTFSLFYWPAALGVDGC